MTQVTTTPSQLRQLVESPAYQKSFVNALGEKRAGIFATSIVSMFNGAPSLQNCEPNSIIKACLVSATMNLPISKDLGFAWIVPYKGVAQFQMGYKGYIQLAIRSGQYKNMNTATVYEGQLVEHNPFTGEFELDHKAKKSDKVIGYYAYFRLVNGFTKELYISKEDMDEHRKKYSKDTRKDAIWNTDFDSMAHKTAIKTLLSKWGILSVEMEAAIKFDQAVVEGGDELDEFTPYYVDNDKGANIKQVPDSGKPEGSAEFDLEEEVLSVCASVPRDPKDIMSLQAMVRAAAKLSDAKFKKALEDYRESKKLAPIEWATWWTSADPSDIIKFCNHIIEQ